MASNVGPTIVQDQLVINLDRDNPRCSLGHGTTNMLVDGLASGSGTGVVSRVQFDGNTADSGVAVGRIGDRKDVLEFGGTNDTGYIGVLFNMNTNAVVGGIYSLSMDIKWISGRDPNHNFEAGNENTGYTWQKHPTEKNVEYNPSNGTGSILFTVYGDGYKSPTSSNIATNYWMYRVDLGDGWYRYKYIYTSGYAGTNQIRFNVQQYGATRYDGTNTKVRMYLDNIQYEKGWPTSFIPGGTTRSNDAVVFDTVSNSQWTMDVTNDNRLLAYDNFNDDGDGTKYRWSGTDYTGLRMSGSGNWDSSPNNNVFTVCGWVYPDADETNTEHFVFQTYNGDTQRNRVHYNWVEQKFVMSGGYSTLAFINGNPQSAVGSAPKGQWHHYAAVFDLGNGSASLYLNGEHKSTVAHTCPNITMANVALGMYNDYDINNSGTGSWSSGSFKGQLPVFQMYHKALSAAEVKQNFEAHRNRFGV
jgi:hypothetical protein